MGSVDTAALFAASVNNGNQYQALLAEWEEEEQRQEAITSHIRRKRQLEAAMRPQPRAVRRRSAKKISFLRRDSSGNLVPMDPRDSTWFILYVDPVNIESPKFKLKFRRRFRMPYRSFLDLVNEMKGHRYDDGSRAFERWQSFDATGNPSSPIELMILGALRYLGRGLTFDDIEEMTCISQETHRQFFEKFVWYGRHVLYPKWVVAPATVEDAQDCIHEMEQAGFNGCVGSMDATHVLHEKINHSQRQSHTSFKLAGTARSYNVTVNHRRQILHSTGGHPCRFNDKTLVRFDNFMQAIRKDALQDVSFYLLENKGNQVVKQWYRGVWVLTDNGYLNWPTTIPPFKVTLKLDELLFSKWLESMRKDVECTFGILKGRWRILKAGIRIHSIEKADNIWATCCALHNWLLDIDGLAEQWNNGVQTDWETDFGDLTTADIPRLRRHNVSESDDDDDDGDDDDDDDDDDSASEDDNDDDSEDEVGNGDSPILDNGKPVKYVKDLSMKRFRSKLVAHFNISYKMGLVKWPSRNGMPRPAFPWTNSE
jgi:DDE superfamily endonuclease